MKNTEHIYRTTLVYRQYTGSEDNDTESTIIDMLADLMHYAEEYGEDFDRALRVARGHYEYESGEDQADDQVRATDQTHAGGLRASV